MADSPSFDDLFLLGLSELLFNRPDLQVYEGDVSEMFLKAGAAMADRCIAASARNFRDTFIDGASGDDLTRLVSDHWGLIRQGANRSQGVVEFSRPFSDGSEPAVAIDAGTIVATEADVNGVVYRFLTDSPASLALGELGPIAVNVTAEVEGIEGNVQPNTVINIADNLTDSSVVVNNPLVMAGGTEIETDFELRTRAREYPSTLRRGTLQALEFGSKQVPSVSNATATEDSSGIVTLYIADASGNASPGMIADVLAELESWRCAGTVINVSAGVPLLVDIAYTLTVRAGTNVLALVPVIEAAVIGYMASLKIGDTLYLSNVQAAIRNVDPVNILEADVVNPSANISPEGDVGLGLQYIIKAGVITNVT